MVRGDMERTPVAHRELLEQAGYHWNAAINAWIRRGSKPGPLRRRFLHADIACTLSREQIVAWIEAGHDQAE
jgi:hypothetical protein